MNIWHADQENNMRPDVDFNVCPWCAGDSIAVESKSILVDSVGLVFGAKVFCHDCGCCGPDLDVANCPDHPLSSDRLYLDHSDERDVVNFAVMVWNCRK